jgi:hypothetical protein
MFYVYITYSDYGFDRFSLTYPNPVSPHACNGHVIAFVLALHSQVLSPARVCPSVSLRAHEVHMSAGRGRGKRPGKSWHGSGLCWAGARLPPGDCARPPAAHPRNESTCNGQAVRIHAEGRQVRWSWPLPASHRLLR